MKHTHHAVDLDQPGKDSFRHREAGAHEVVLVGDARWALLHERRSRPAAGGPGQDELAEVLRRLAPVDLVLVEGFARTPGPRIEVVREAIASGAGKTPLWPDDPGVEAVALRRQARRFRPVLAAVGRSRRNRRLDRATLRSGHRPAMRDAGQQRIAALTGCSDNIS